MGQLQTSCTMNTQEEQTLKETDSLRHMSFDGIPSWGRVGSIRGWSHRVVKHKVVPANCCQCVGAAVEPAHALDKVLVLPIPVPAKQEYVVSILNRQTINQIVQRKVWRLTLHAVQSSAQRGSSRHWQTPAWGRWGGKGTEFQLCSNASDEVRKSSRGPTVTCVLRRPAG